MDSLGKCPCCAATKGNHDLFFEQRCDRAPCQTTSGNLLLLRNTDSCRSTLTYVDNSLAATVRATRVMRSQTHAPSTTGQTGNRASARDGQFVLSRLCPRLFFPGQPLPAALLVLLAAAAGAGVVAAQLLHQLLPRDLLLRPKRGQLEQVSFGLSSEGTGRGP